MKRSLFPIMIALTIHDSYEMVTFNLIRLLVKNSEGYTF
jgi:hypothetical protein